MHNNSQLSSRPDSTTGKRITATLLRIVAGTIGIAIWLWCIGFAYSLDDNNPTWITRLIALAIAVAIPILVIRFRRHRRWIPLTALVIVFAISLTSFRLMKPSHDREWSIPQAQLPYADIQFDAASGQNLVVVNNIRAFRYGPSASGDRGGDSHYNDTYDLEKLESVWFGVDRFTDVEPLAHTFLSFGFEEGSHRTNYLAFSVETRREKDELTYSPFRGIFNNYEIIYVIADEQDVLAVRSNVRENVVQLYPVRATRDQARAMLLDMLQRANSIRDNPEFYHTLTSNCTNNIVSHTNKVLDEPISAWQQGVVFPGYSDWLAHRLGIIDTDLPLAEAREKFRIDQRVKVYDGTSDFSKFIRER